MPEKHLSTGAYLSLANTDTLPWLTLQMTRKLILTCFLIFLGAGWVQMAFGALITFVFLLLNLAYRPYCTDGLNR